MRVTHPAGIHDETLQGAARGHQLGPLGDPDLAAPAFADVGNFMQSHHKAPCRTSNSCHDKRLENEAVVRLIKLRSARQHACEHNSLMHESATLDEPYRVIKLGELLLPQMIR